MNQIQASNLANLILGRKGENLARQVVFDLSAWVAEYGPGIAELIYQRPGDAAPYLVAAVREDDTLVWTLTATDTDCSGDYGHCELRWYVGDLLAKSNTWRTWVESAMDTPSETAPPKTEQGWVDQVVAVGASAKASAEAAKADADRAEAIAQEVAQNAAKTAQEATGAEQAKEAAQTAQKLAEAAKSAAEAAKQAAETAQSAANKSATDAYGAKQAAEAALKATQDAATEAAQSLSALRALYEQMQTWAAGIVQSVSDEGARQVQSVRDEGITQTANAKAQADAAKLSADAAAQSATDAGNAKTGAETAKDAAVTAQGKADDAKKGSEAARDRAEAAAIKQPYPNAETGTWWTWDADKAAYVDSGEPYEGATLYATFDVDPATGKLSVYIPARYHGPTFSLNEENGKLEVTVNG